MVGFALALPTLQYLCLDAERRIYESGYIMMRRVVISTVGTSLLTNQINRANPDEKDWYVQLRDSAT